MSIDKVDSIDYGTNWKAGRPTVKDGQFFHVLSSGAQKMLVKNSVRNTNPNLPHDVNADGIVSPIDALAVVNLLNRSSRPELSSDGPMSSEELASFQYYDVNGSGYVSPIDILLIINFLNRRKSSGEGEFVANPGVAISSFTQAQINAGAVRFVHDKDKLQGGRGNDLLIGGSTENQDDLASLDAALADWVNGDWALALFDLGDIIDDDEEDDLKGEEGLDMLFGGFGDKVKH